MIPQLGAANRAISRYDGILHAIPNPDVLLAPLRTQEAVLSSAIEGTQTTLGEVLEFEASDETKGASRREDFREVLNYRYALSRAENELKTRPFNLNLLLELHRVLLNSVRGENKARGRFRTVQNWIGSAGCTIAEAQFVPPEPAAVMPAMDQWEKYYHSDEHDPLGQLAVVHAQFEVIHPFLDGNGRLGRILIPLFLFEKKIIHRPMFYLSAWLEENRDGYVERLRRLGVVSGAWTEWVQFFLRAISEQADRNARKVQDIKALYDDLKGKCIELTRSQFAVPLLDQIFQRPAFTGSSLCFPAPRPSRPVIGNLLSALTKAGIIEVVRPGSGRRPSLYTFRQLIALCEAK